MRNKIKRVLLLLTAALLFGLVFTGVVYRFFPQFLCYVVYDVGEGNLERLMEEEMQPGMRLTEIFVPQNRYLRGVSIGMNREDSDNTLVGRLLDDQGKVLGESRFALTDSIYEFSFHTWVEPGREYRLEVLFPEENSDPVKVVFGTGDRAAEHVGIFVNENASDNLLNMGFIYGIYSRKLLAFWFLAFFAGGSMIGETVLCRMKM